MRIIVTATPAFNGKLKIDMRAQRQVFSPILHTNLQDAIGRAANAVIDNVRSTGDSVGRAGWTIVLSFDQVP